LEPIAFLADSPYWIISKNAVPAKNLAELIAWLKANPGTATAGSIAGGGSHVCGAYLQNSTGTKFQLVPYRGGAPALQDLVAGQIDFMCDFAANSLEQFRSGKVRAYAVMAKHRWYAAPEIPTADEAGLPGFYISNWSGLWAPAGTPQDIIGKLNAAIVAALADATIRKRYLDLGQEMPPVAQQTPQALRDLHKAEVEKWFPIVEAAGIRG
jgi:tripartite-type tricarboxylate transporter receptor subunit TctC